MGLGSNLGDRQDYLKKALSLLQEKLELLKVSSVYETEPQGFREQPPFLNAVCQVKTDLEPLQLLKLVKDVESRLGRKPRFRNAPREIDIDILFYGDLVVELPELTIPHPRLSERAFVLVPLAEIAPGLVEPVSRKTIRQLLEAVPGKDGVRLFSSPSTCFFIFNLLFML